MELRLLKAYARDWLPPALLRWSRKHRRAGIVYAGDFSAWQEARNHSSGYDAEEILARVLASTLKVKQGEAVFERDSVAFEEMDYAWLVLTGLMWTAARNGGKLNVLDFGGALGSSYFQNRKFLQTLPEVQWNIVEQEHYVDAGRKQVQEGRLRFYKTITECLSENKPNIVILSSVLQYLEKPEEVIRELNMVGAHCLVIDRTPFSSTEKNRLVVQEVPPSIYPASYPMWIFSSAKFEKIVSKHWNVIASTLSPEGAVRTTDGTAFVFQGMLLESR